MIGTSICAWAQPAADCAHRLLFQVPPAIPPSHTETMLGVAVITGLIVLPLIVWLLLIVVAMGRCLAALVAPHERGSPQTPHRVGEASASTA